MSAARNIAIVAAVALAVWALPGGGRAADLVAAVLSILFAVGMAFFAARLYAERRLEILGLPDRHRALLYGALVVAVLGFASPLRDTGLGLLVLVGLLSGCGVALGLVYATWRER